MGLRSWLRGRRSPPADPLLEQIRQAFPDAEVTVAHETIELAGDEDVSDDVRAALAAAGIPLAAPGSSEDGDDPATQLERLAALHHQGVLTDAEFSAARARVIDRAG